MSGQFQILAAAANSASLAQATAQLKSRSHALKVTSRVHCSTSQPRHVSWAKLALQFLLCSFRGSCSRYGGEITFKVQEGRKVCGVDALHIEGAQGRASSLRRGAIHCDSIHREKLHEDNNSVTPSALQHVSFHISQ